MEGTQIITHPRCLLKPGELSALLSEAHKLRDRAQGARLSLCWGRLSVSVGSNVVGTIVASSPDSRMQAQTVIGWDLVGWLLEIKSADSLYTSDEIYFGNGEDNNSLSIVIYGTLTYSDYKATVSWAKDGEILDTGIGPLARPEESQRPFLGPDVLTGRLITGARQVTDPGFDDRGLLELQFADGGTATIISTYGNHTGSSRGEYPTDVLIVRAPADRCLILRRAVNELLVKAFWIGCTLADEEVYAGLTWRQLVKTVSREGYEGSIELLNSALLSYGVEQFFARIASPSINGGGSSDA